MNKILPLIAFLILLLVPAGIQKGYSLTHVSIYSSLFDSGFDPTSVVILPGETVEWQNDRSQTLTLDGNNAFSPVSLGSGETFSHVFNDLGTYPIDADDGFIFHASMTVYVQVTSPPPEPISCGPKTFPNAQNQCVPDLIQICGQGTTPNFNTITCIATNIGNMIGGTLLDIDTTALLVASIGVNPIITGLVGITIAGIAGQTVWFVYRRKKSENS